VRQHERRVGGECAEDVRGAAVVEIVKAAPQGLAIDGDMALATGLCRRVQGRGMATKHRLHRGGIELPKDAADRRVGGRPTPFQAERVAQPGEVDVDKAVNCAVGISANKLSNGENGAMATPLWLGRLPDKESDASASRESLCRHHRAVGAIVWHFGLTGRRVAGKRTER
jgi:hypothetical protein